MSDGLNDHDFDNHKRYIEEHGEDDPRISGWRWGRHAGGKRKADPSADNV